MNSRTKRILSTVAIVIASVVFGVVISADLGLMRKSNAQSAPIQTTSSSAPITSVTVPSFADIASRVAPAVVSITSTEVIKPTAGQNPRGFGIDPFDFFFPNPNGSRRRPNSNRDNGDDEHLQRAGGRDSSFRPTATSSRTITLSKAHRKSTSTTVPTLTATAATRFRRRSSAAILQRTSRC